MFKQKQADLNDNGSPSVAAFAMADIIDEELTIMMNGPPEIHALD